MVNYLEHLSFSKIIALIFAENLSIVLLVIGMGEVLVQLHQSKRIASPKALSTREIGLTLLNLVLNSFITLLGYILWKHKIIIIHENSLSRFIIDLIVLILVMDFVMYVLHRIAHLRIFYPLLHKTHHQFENPRPMNLFALNPLENLSFGILWLGVISLYAPSWAGMITYLMFNALFGMIGHLGVEPFSKSWGKIPVLKYISTSTFHTQHHQDMQHNFGFYTLLWDKLFKTISPQYFNSWFKSK